MNYVEALKALKSGKCEKIRIDSSEYMLSKNGSIVWCSDPTELINKRINDLISDNWELVDPVIEYEEKEVTSYAVYDGVSFCSIFYHKSMAKKYVDSQDLNNPSIVELKGAIKVPIKEKTKHKIDISSMFAEYECVCYIDRILPKEAKYYAEWEE